MRTLSLFLLLFVINTSFSQITHPKASPFSLIEQEIGLSKISIEYSRPAARERKVFGGIVPFGRIWRVGANKSTKITVDTDMIVLGNLLPKGTYALYAFPEKEEWQIAFHTNTSHWGDGRKNYNADEDAFRIKVKPEIIPYHQENFLMAFDAITHDAANLNLIWADTKVTIPFRVDTHAQMELEIAKQLKENPTAQTYYEAARYLQEQGKDFERALNYLNRALELGGDTYYFHRVKSLVEAELGTYKAAISSAEKSLKIASELEKDEFVRMNTTNIKKWQALLENN
jgi:tetratricopeptide (TPR) repeat protein